MMADPLSIAASVAGLAATAGTASKGLYQFFQYIHDAPSVAKDLAHSLHILHLVLSQIQELLLDPDFVSATDNAQLETMYESLAGCVSAIDKVKIASERSGLASGDQRTIRKAWSSIKAWFNEDQMRECLDRIEREKSTLHMGCSIILMQVNHHIYFLGARLRKNRRVGVHASFQVQRCRTLIEQQGRGLSDL